MNSTFYKVCLFAMMILIISCDNRMPSIDVVPYPTGFSQQAGVLSIRAGATISVKSSDLQPLATLLADDIYRIHGIRLDSNPKTEGDIVLELAPLGERQYLIEIAGDITIVGHDYTTVAQGITTLIQMSKLIDGKLELPKIRMVDKPTSSFRSVMIDVARQVVDITTLRQVVDLCRIYKVPYLQLHISDDQAFCFPSTTYPELATAGHSYTLSELEELVSYATQRGIIIIPELDGPGHSSSIRKVKPEVFGSPDNYTVDLTMDTMYAATKILIKEMMDVFHTSPYFHIGADEAYLSPDYLNSPRVKQYLKHHNLEGEDLKREYVVKLDHYIKSLGKKTMAWESFKSSNRNQRIEIPKDILVNAWETLYEHPDSLINNGFDIINTSWKPYYTVRSHRWHPEYIYNFSENSYANHWNRAPSYNQFDIPASSKTIGGQMCAWEQFDVQIIEGLRSRLPAFSENYWSSEKLGFDNYLNRFKSTDLLFEKMITGSTIEVIGTRGSSDRMKTWDGATIPNPAGLQNNSQHFFDESATITINTVHPKSTIYYTTDGTMPSTNSKSYDSPLTINESTHIRYKVMNDGVQVGYNQILLEHRPIKAILEGLSDTARVPEPYWYQDVYTDTLQIALYLNDPDVFIRVTLDGSEPTEDQPLYKGPISIYDDEPTIVRAQAYKNGKKYGDEWRPADYYDNVKFYQPKRWYKFKKAGS